jgi:two-component system, cell cycle response regulator DivK
MKDEDAPVVLIVEDDEDILELLFIWVQKEGYRVITARDGAEAVEVARRECPDLVLMDMSLPVLDGISATERILEIEELCHVPILACSANSIKDWEIKAVAAGCRAYVSKPVDLGMLSRLLKQYLPGNRNPIS